MLAHVLVRARVINLFLEQRDDDAVMRTLEQKLALVCHHLGPDEARVRRQAAVTPFV